MTSYAEAAVVHKATAYFSNEYDVYSYMIPEDEWSKLEPCCCKHFGMAVVNDKLTTIGGQRNTTATNTLLCLSGDSSEVKWEELLPSIPTKQVRPAAVTTPTHLVVAGGRKYDTVGIDVGLSTVEVLNLHTLQWASASSSPEALGYPICMTLCDEHVYWSGDKTILSCSVEELVKSCNPASTNSSAGDSVWTRLPDTRSYNTTLATHRGRVLIIGGRDKPVTGTPTGTIDCYDRSTNSWSAIGEMLTPRYDTLVAVLPSNELVVVGGYERKKFNISSNITEIAD